MNILKESKETLPESFITSFISKEWDEISSLQDLITALKKEYTGSSKVCAILESLLDSCTICVGQLENLLSKKELLADDAKKEALKEDVTDDAKIIGALIKDEAEAIQGYEAAKDELVDPAKRELADHIEAEEVEHVDELAAILDLDNDKPAEDEVSADDAFNCDFPDPVGPKLTDLELYPEIKQSVSDAPKQASTIKPATAMDLSDIVMDVAPASKAPAKVEKPAEMVSDDDDWNQEFPEPVGAALTDDDLYPENKDVELSK